MAGFLQVHPAAAACLQPNCLLPAAQHSLCCTCSPWLAARALNGGPALLPSLARLARADMNLARS